MTRDSGSRYRNSPFFVVEIFLNSTRGQKFCYSNINLQQKILLADI